MIELNRINNKPFILNCELIKMIESTPDTMITLTTGEKLLVKESVQEVVRRTVDFRKRLFQEPFTVATQGSG